MLNFVICDDNENSLSKFSKMLNLVFENNNLDGQILLSTPNAYDALNFIAKNTIDVVILDIDLQADISGLDLAQKIRKINKNAYIIFATAHLEYLIMAYKYAGLGESLELCRDAAKGFVEEKERLEKMKKQVKKSWIASDLW